MLDVQEVPLKSRCSISELLHCVLLSVLLILICPRSEAFGIWGTFFKLCRHSAFAAASLNFGIQKSLSVLCLHSSSRILSEQHPATGKSEHFGGEIGDHSNVLKNTQATGACRVTSNNSVVKPWIIDNSAVELYQPIGNQNAPLDRSFLQL